MHQYYGRSEESLRQRGEQAFVNIIEASIGENDDDLALPYGLSETL